MPSAGTGKGPIKFNKQFKWLYWRIKLTTGEAVRVLGRTYDNALRITAEITKNYNLSKTTLWLRLNSEAAFDTVWQAVSMHKMPGHTVCMYNLIWIICICIHWNNSFHFTNRIRLLPSWADWCLESYKKYMIMLYIIWN